MLLALPVRNELPAYRMTVELEQAFYQLSLRYNARQDAWYLDLAQESRVLVSGIRLVNSPDLLAQFRHMEGLPAGKLIVHDLEGRFADAHAADFGDRVLLLYERTP